MPTNLWSSVCDFTMRDNNKSSQKVRGNGNTSRGRKDGANGKSFDLKVPFGKLKRRDCAGDSTKIE